MLSLSETFYVDKFEQSPDIRMTGGIDGEVRPTVQTKLSLIRESWNDGDEVETQFLEVELTANGDAFRAASMRAFEEALAQVHQEKTDAGRVRVTVDFLP